jgi:CRISPR-associated protein Csc2
MEISEFKDSLSEGTVDKIHNTRQNRYTHLLLLREVTSPARFTTDGETANTTNILIGDPEEETYPIRAVDLFYRKQPGAERRTAKKLQRDLLSDDDDCADDHMHPNQMKQNTPESVLFGSAAGDEAISQRSRVYYNTAYTLRDANVVLRQNVQNAPGDETRNESSEGQGTWTPDFVQPGALFPSVVTLDSAVPEEVLFTMAAIARTNRYGAGETRGGNVTNHFLGAYAGSNDSPSNLELTRQTAAIIAGENDDSLESFATQKTVDVGQAKEAVKDAYEGLLDRSSIETEKVAEEEVSAVVGKLRGDEVLKKVMRDQHEEVQDYIERFDSS